MTYYKELNKCFNWLDKILTNLDHKGIDKYNIIIQAQNIFCVSEKAIEKRIKLYEKAGIIKINNNLLKKQ